MSIDGRLAITKHLASTGTGENKLDVFEAARNLPDFPAGGTIRQQSEFAFAHAERSGINPITLDKATAFIRSIPAEEPAKRSAAKRSIPAA